MSNSGLVRRFVRWMGCDSPTQQDEHPVAVASADTSVESPLVRVTKTCETVPEHEQKIIEKLVRAYKDGTEAQLKAAAPYQPGAGWKTLLDNEWRVYRQALLDNDVPKLAGFFRNFFRNEGLSGFWGSENMFDVFANQPNIYRDLGMLQQYNVWRELFPTTPIAELDAPKIGNPWGYEFDNCLLYEPVFEYHYQADYFHSLLSHLDTPVVLEIGGGFGGLAQHILKRIPGAKYIGFDLPENSLLQTYYLSCAFPNARVLCYSNEVTAIDRKTLDSYDIICLPNFMLPSVDSSLADLIVNVRSLSEMPAETIAEYLSQVDRVGRLWFFHENIFRDRRDNAFGIPSTKYPPLRNHQLVSSAESRWPKWRGDSGYACKENLFLHKAILKR